MPDAVRTSNANEVPEVLRGEYNTLRSTAASILALANELRSDCEDIKNRLHLSDVTDGVCGGAFTMGPAGAAVTLALSGNVRYRIGGIEYAAELPTTVALQDRGDIADTKFGAWRVLIDRLGVVTTQDTGALMAFASAEKALASLSQLAPTANTAVLGYLVLGANGAVFNIGTTNLNAGTVTGLVISHVRQPIKQASGLTAAVGAATAATAAAATYGTGTVDVKRNGVRLAQIAAAAGRTMTDADTITTLKWGGWLVCVNLAGTGFITVAADGVVGSVSAMAYTSQALAEAALDTVEDQLPALFVPVARIVVHNASLVTFTAGTTNWDAVGITATVTDATVGTWDRTDIAGFSSHRIAAAVLPDAPSQAAVTMAPTESVSLL